MNQGLVYAGIDEAGYGPRLGPLCVGLGVFRVQEWQPGDPAPDLWRQLAPAVTREVKDRKGRIPFADSKVLKLSNQLKKSHPLRHLERGVMAMLGATSDIATTDTDLFDTLAVALTSGGGASFLLSEHATNAVHASKIGINKYASFVVICFPLNCEPKPTLNNAVKYGTLSSWLWSRNRTSRIT